MTSYPRSHARALSLALTVSAIAALAIPSVAVGQNPPGPISGESRWVEEPELELRSPSSSTRASLAATVLPTLAGIGLYAGGVENPLIAIGLYLGPAVGYWSGGVGGRGWAGVGIRSGLALGGGLLAIALCGDNGLVCENEGVVTAVLVATTVGIAASSISDIVRVDDHVEARNERLRREAGAGPRLSVSPTLGFSDGGTIGIRGSIRM